LGDADAGMPNAPIFLSPRRADSSIAIGARTRVTNGVEAIALERIEIGEECAIGAGTRIVDADFHGVAPGERRMEGASGPVRIGDRVWIGMGAMVLKRVRIGDAAVIAAGAVVSADVAEGAVSGGNPARVISRWAASK
jgi:acetyltransferase-like isoleucine patch superfamily enzyme